MHQISFAAFAQRPLCPPPPASANGSVLSLPAPAEPGVGVGTPPIYDGAFELFRRLSVRHVAGGHRGDWFLDWQVDGCSMDAPDALPSGSHCALVLSDSRVMADGYGGFR